MAVLIASSLRKELSGEPLFDNVSFKALPGDLIALVDSEDHLEIAVVNGNAAQQLDAKVGDVVEVIYL